MTTQQDNRHSKLNVRLCVRANVLVLLLLLPLLSLLHLGEVAAEAVTSPNYPSLHPLSTPYTLQGYEVAQGDTRREVEVVQGEGKRQPSGEATGEERDGAPRQKPQKVLVVHESETGKMALAGVMGACLGVMGGVLLMLLLGCCYLRCSRHGTLVFDRKNNTYRSADLIDGGV